MNFGRVITAMVTPFNKEKKVDYPIVSHLVEHLLSNGTDGLVIAGTTGESPTLTSEEKIMLWKYVKQAAKGRAPVIAGAGSNNTEETIKLSKEAAKAGVDALMLVTPYYNKPNQAGLYAHFKAVAEAVDVPIMIYNVPGRTAVTLTPETIIKLSQVENIVSLKEASGNLTAMAEVIDKADHTFSVYSGDDDLTLPAYAIGAAGIVSVSSHIIGNQMQEMLALYGAGKRKQAGELHRKLLPIFKGMFSSPSPSPVKEALRQIGIDTGGVRLPLVGLTDEEKRAISHLIAQIKQ